MDGNSIIQLGPSKDIALDGRRTAAEGRQSSRDFGSVCHKMSDSGAEGQVLWSLPAIQSIRMIIHRSNWHFTPYRPKWVSSGFQ